MSILLSILIWWGTGFLGCLVIYAFDTILPEYHEYGDFKIYNTKGITIQAMVGTFLASCFSIIIWPLAGIYILFRFIIWCIESNTGKLLVEWKNKE